MHFIFIYDDIEEDVFGIPSVWHLIRNGGKLTYRWPPSSINRHIKNAIAGMDTPLNDKWGESQGRIIHAGEFTTFDGYDEVLRKLRNRPVKSMIVSGPASSCGRGKRHKRKVNT